MPQTWRWDGRSFFQTDNRSGDNAQRSRNQVSGDSDPVDLRQNDDDFDALMTYDDESSDSDSSLQPCELDNSFKWLQKQFSTTPDRGIPEPNSRMPSSSYKHRRRQQRLQQCGEEMYRIVEQWGKAVSSPTASTRRERWPFRLPPTVKCRPRTLSASQESGAFPGNAASFLAGWRNFSGSAEIPSDESNQSETQDDDNEADDESSQETTTDESWTELVTAVLVPGELILFTGATPLTYRGQQLRYILPKLEETDAEGYPTQHCNTLPRITFPVTVHKSHDPEETSSNSTTDQRSTGKTPIKCSSEK